MTSTTGTGEHPTGEHPEVSEISELTDGLLSPSRTAELRDHLATCPLCDDVYASLEEIRSLLGTLPGPLRILSRCRQAASMPPSPPKRCWTPPLPSPRFMFHVKQPPSPSWFHVKPTTRLPAEERRPPGPPDAPGAPPDRDARSRGPGVPCAALAADSARHRSGRGSTQLRRPSHPERRPRRHPGEQPGPSHRHPREDHWRRGRPDRWQPGITCPRSAGVQGLAQIPGHQHSEHSRHPTARQRRHRPVLRPPWHHTSGDSTGDAPHPLPGPGRLPRGAAGSGRSPARLCVCHRFLLCLRHPMRLPGRSCCRTRSSETERREVRCDTPGMLAP